MRLGNSPINPWRHPKSMRDLTIADVTEYCARYGLELIEYEAFYGPAHEIPLGLENLAHFITPNDFSWWAEQPPEKDYLAALHSLLGKGLIQIPQKTLNRHASEVGLPSHQLIAGSVCFTQSGYRLYRRISQDLNRLQGPLPQDHSCGDFHSIDALKRQKTYTGTSRKQCMSFVWGYTQKSIGYPSAFSHCSLIRRIGPWHSSFYQRHRQGYQVDIFYRHQRAVKLRDAQIDLSAKVECRAPLFIAGTIGATPFSFTESVSWRPDCKHWTYDMLGDHNAWLCWSFTCGEKTIVDPSAQQHEGFIYGTRPWSDHLSPAQALKLIRGFCI